MPALQYFQVSPAPLLETIWVLPAAGLKINTDLASEINP